MGERYERAILKVFGAPDFTLRVRQSELIAPRLLKVDFERPEMLRAVQTHPGFWLRLWLPGADGNYQRGYTVIDADQEAGTFSVEFYLHGAGGVADTWAQAAQPGDEIEASLYGGKEKFDVGNASAVLLVGDLTSLPAINEIAAKTQLPTTVLLEATNPGDEDFPTTSPDAQWVPQQPGSANTLAA
ncbi:siderophore-interacting protein [Renibacterium salmoninarum ATCC 33209]|uniref:Siderophore-interacting protein n=1 Tax=Renibacterium salmoninarum (strain ATCC 33209 / DSM 20767 / JCM 11484 / NBRC 15589 / NCIMB 2235) TaxID=288705 RepID=A9WNW4_RENSM|nr:siderophore-interacting protein [Renibacterium salmoninarum]ABY22759.1 siderophore-interacting protein [Renibacterium salmoninarum ATCC 33209]